MEDSQIKEPSGKTWEIASMTRIGFARIFDLLICSIPAMIATFFLPLQGWTSILASSMIAFVVLVSYFIVVPLFFHGNTIGKIIFRIKLKKASKITFLNIFLRESFFVILPWLISMLLKIGAFTIFSIGDSQNDNPNSNGFWIAFAIGRLGDLFYLVWALFLFLTIKIQTNHQSGIDLRFGIYAVKNIALEDRKDFVKSSPTEEVGKHVHLQDNLPAKFSEDVIKEINDID
ncbi:hypothetical protein SSABA_v1c00910 [Spiroplasma sabaudiense Ar-1343]|uniref:RDD domain-containing protein n=1 Tax=Spiroplasma sabaudiense Ar-1343 TaxID=1276257 RepID=W6A8K6_9MOLU|nr:RDD family protein [Spiroplasma sabaudiense]AHI53503.1 hypothetical protein SSABA_v1c00910 [Spiroplasma sabaudiense Ar-1343]